MKRREKTIMLSAIFLSIVVVIGLLYYVFGDSKGSSISIDVKEEIPLPIVVIVSCQGEETVIYESDSITNTESKLASYSIKAEGAIWLMIGAEKYEILPFIDHVDLPIIEITGDATSLEVVAYTTLFQQSENTHSHTTIMIQG